MRRLRRMLGFDASQGESGVALAMALIFGVVITIVSATAISFAVSGLKKSSSDEDWNGAIAAAYAGLEDYQAHLSNDNAYQKYGNPAAPFSAASSVTLPTGAQANPAFGIGTGGTWQTIKKADGTTDSGARYRYEVDNSTYAATGTLKIRVTGQVGQRVRSVVANLRQQGFINFLYFTNFEVLDPNIYTPTGGQTVASCSKYAWAGRSTSCSNIAFGNGDTINGPVHSNDTIRICAATFKGIVTTSNPNVVGGKRYTATDSNGTACSGQSFPAQTTAGPTYASTIGIPATNGNLIAETRSDLTGSTVPRPGCLYTGPTKIVYSVDGSGNGLMTVKSPNTKFTNIASPDANGNYTAGSNPSQCGTPGTATNGLASTAGATIPVISNNLIYVQNIPTNSADKNYTSTTTLPQTCGFDGTNQATKTDNGVGYPIKNESAPAPSYACPYGTRNGDVFVQGTFHGQNTISSANYTYVTDDILYQDANADLLGLVSQNPIFIWNPIKYSGTCVSGSCNATALLNTAAYSNDYNRTIDAAMISVSDMIQVQSTYGGGARGTLNVYGAIAQNYRGVVTTGSNGYVKNYNYDQRLLYQAPPKFLSPVTTTYGVTVLEEVPTAMNPDGSSK